jgi:hypothetical protein
VNVAALVALAVLILGVSLALRSAKLGVAAILVPWLIALAALIVDDRTGWLSGRAR